MNFITLTGYYPQRHEVCLAPDFVAAVIKNVVNENSQGSVVHMVGAGVAFQVQETPAQILEILEGEHRG